MTCHRQTDTRRRHTQHRMVKLIQFLSLWVLFDIFNYVFANRIVGKWNVLPDSCMICTTLNDFKTKIKLQLEPETQM